MRLCKDCRHWRRFRGYPELSECLSPAVNEWNSIYLINATHGAFADFARRPDGRCRPEAKHFEPAPVSWWTRAKRYLKERYGQ